MAVRPRKRPVKRGPPRPGRRLANPFVLAGMAVAVVFAVAIGLSTLLGGEDGAPPRPAAVTSVAVPTPPAPARPALAELAKPSAPPPPAVETAALPPPVPPLQPPPGMPPGAPLWQRNAVPVDIPAGRPLLAVVIDDMGLDRKRSARAAALPGPLTLSWLPYAAELGRQAHAARAAGHELMLHLPMEPSGKADPGPGALLIALDRAEVQRRLDAALDSFDGFVGVNNHMGSRFTADRARMAPVLAAIGRRGLLWLDSRTTPQSTGSAIAAELGMAHADRDVFLDNDPSAAAVRAQLARLEDIARRKGAAIAIGHPHDATIEALATWLPQVRSRGFALVPVSAVVRARMAGG